MNNLQELYPKIGQVVVEFQTIDMILNLLLSDFIDRPPYGRTLPNISKAILTVIPFSRKVDLFRECSNSYLQDQVLVNRVNDIISLMDKAEKERNRVIHTSWGSMKAGGVFGIKPKVSRNKGLQDYHIYDVTNDQLENAIESIKNAKSTLIILARDLKKKGVVFTSLG